MLANYFRLHHTLQRSSNYSTGWRNLMEYRYSVKVLLVQRVLQVLVLLELGHDLHHIYLGILKVCNIKFHFHIVHKSLQNIVDHNNHNLVLLVQLVLQVLGPLELGHLDLYKKRLLHYCLHKFQHFLHYKKAYLGLEHLLQCIDAIRLVVLPML
jgi:hypothetical protein